MGTWYAVVCLICEIPSWCNIDVMVDVAVEVVVTILALLTQYFV